MKRILLICLAMLWLVPSVALAHSKLESAVPAQDSTAAVTPERIEMTFNTKIESLSNFKLLNAAGEEMEKGKTEVDGMTMSASVPSVLPNGIYSVKWTIIGADGHSVEGDYSFTVEAPLVTDEPTAEPDTITESPAVTELPSPSPEASAAPDSGNESAASSDDTNYTPAVIIGTIIVIAAVVLMLRRRK
ncbi:copper resistance CopC family protein [Paenibacillus luteus]|uniref:copper resistance CopC family protein n=1 Tax=Paenibacillus luteus TaxID=2545753 RepID=UPI0013762F60|nr:copper resistance protein CopC [Paenibacillus luteus]